MSHDDLWSELNDVLDSDSTPGGVPLDPKLFKGKDDSKLHAGSTSRPTAAPPLRVEPGTRLADRYTLVRLLDRGAMGAVWYANDARMDHPVAIKLIRLPATGRRERATLITRVIGEAKTARLAGSQCAHIVQIHDVSRLEATSTRHLFIVMEYLDGYNLADWMAERDIDWLTTREIGVQLATALKALHAHGIVHRDIKPANIFTVASEERADVPFIKLIDFGIAKDAERAAMTQMNTSLGTKRYTAPEQAQAASQSTSRSDVFSCGIVLYELLCGHNPLPIDDALRFAMYQDGLPACMPTTSETPRWLCALVDRCLSINASDRPSASELLAALKAGAQPNFEYLLDDGAGWIPEAEDLADDFEGAEGEDPEGLDDAEALALLEGESLPAGVGDAPAPALPPDNPLDAIDAALQRPAQPQAPLHSLQRATQGPEPVTQAPALFVPTAPLPQMPAGTEERYHQRGKPRTGVPLAIAVFIGLGLIAAAILYTKPTSTPEPRKVAATASQPELPFKPRGPVDLDDFPAAPRSAPRAVQPASVESANLASAQSIPTARPTSPATKVRATAKRRAKPTKPRVRTRRSAAPKRGVTRSFAELAAAARAGGPAAVPPTDGAPTVTARYKKSGGPRFADEDEIKPATPKLPLLTKMQARLSTGVSSATHGVALATLTESVKVDGKIVLPKGAVLKGKSANTNERIVIRFTTAQAGNTSIDFVGVAHSLGDLHPGLKAKKRIIPKEERGGNAVARGALTTAGRTAARIGGGVAGELVGDVAREGIGEARPDFQERAPFVLTVPKGLQFTVVVTGK